MTVSQNMLRLQYCSFWSLMLSDIQKMLPMLRPGHGGVYVSACAHRVHALFDGIGQARRQRPVYGQEFPSEQANATAEGGAAFPSISGVDNSSYPVGTCPDAARRATSQYTEASAYTSRNARNSGILTSTANSLTGSEPIGLFALLSREHNIHSRYYAPGYC